jgi:hypothetical protein
MTADCVLKNSLRMKKVLQEYFRYQPNREQCRQYPFLIFVFYSYGIFLLHYHDVKMHISQRFYNTILWYYQLV